MASGAETGKHGPRVRIPRPTESTAETVKDQLTFSDGNAGPSANAKEMPERQITFLADRVR